MVVACTIYSLARATALRGGRARTLLGSAGRVQTARVAAPRRRQQLQPARAQAPTDGGVGALPSGSSGDEFGGAAAGQPPGAQPGAAPKQAGPLAAVKGLLLAYDRAAKERPVITKALTSFVGFAVGDRIAQSVTPGVYDPFRCARLSLYGLLIDGPIGHAWYQLLDRHVCPEDPTSNKAVLIKTALDQLVWGPAMTLVFFAFLKTLEGRPDLILATIHDKFWPTMLANYVLWPLAHLVNFKYVPSDWRILFNNVVAIFWTTYLSFTCGPASGLAGGGAHGGGAEATAAAASALLSVFPCSKVPGALSSPGVADAARQVAAIEHIVNAWGAKSLQADSLVAYLQLKAEVMQRVCQAPVRLPPS